MKIEPLELMLLFLRSLNVIVKERKNELQKEKSLSFEQFRSPPCSMIL